MTYLFSLLFIFVPLIWLPNTSELFEFNKIMATYILAVLIGGIWIIRMIRERRIIFRKTPLDIPLLLLLLSTFISLLLSVDQRISWAGYYSRWNGGLQSLISYSLLYWAFVSNMNRKSALSTIFYSLLSATLISIYGILEHFGHSISCLLVTPTHTFDVSCWVQDVQNRVFATLGQPNWMAAYLVSLMFIPISNLLNLKFKILNLKSISNFIIFNLLFVALLFTKSRSGLLAFGISSVVFFSTTLSFPPPKVGGGRKGAVLTMFGFAFLILVLLLAFQNPLGSKIQDLRSKPTGTVLETSGTESGNIRKIVWTGAIKIWLGNTKNFFVGTGPETFALSYYQYRPIEHNATSEWDLLYNKAHNEFLNQLATTGLLGLVGYLILLVFMGWIFIKTIYDHRMTTNDNSMTIALFAGWLSILVTNFWGFSVVITQIFLFLFPALSIVISDQLSVISNEKKKSINGKQVFGIIVVLLSTFYFLLSTFQYWNNDRLYTKGQNYYRYFVSNNQADYLFSALDFTQMALISGHEPTFAIDFASYTALVQMATVSAQAANFAINSSPNNPSYLRSIAKSQIILNNYTDAYENLIRAQKLSPTDPKIPYTLGIVFLGLGKKEEAKIYFEKALLLKPDWPDPKNQLTLLK